MFTEVDGGYRPKSVFIDSDNITVEKVQYGAYRKWYSDEQFVTDKKHNLGAGIWANGRYGLDDVKSDAEEAVKKLVE